MRSFTHGKHFRPALILQILIASVILGTAGRAQTTSGINASSPGLRQAEQGSAQWKPCEVRPVMFAEECAASLEKYYRTPLEVRQPISEVSLALLEMNVGIAYAQGDGVAKDWQLAATFIRHAAERGNVAAQFVLGTLYTTGDSSLPKDYTEAATWWRKAADQGDADAEEGLGTLYANGLGVLKDDTEALKWFRKAADQGSAKGQFRAGQTYLLGNGVEVDLKRAAEWFQRAATQGYTEAQGVLAVMYMLGQGVPRDYVLAYMWANLAAAVDDNKSPGMQGNRLREMRDKQLTPRMTREQIAEAQRLSREWKPVKAK
jgi:TPR repeat protein